MGLFHYLWSRTAASNATADSNVNWAEGQAPSSVNDSARAMMASAAAFRDDIAGAIVTGGTSTAYTVTSFQVFDSLAHMNGMEIAFTPHATNGATVTLNVDGLGAKPLRSAPSVELQAGTLILGTPYMALYNNSDAVFYLKGFYGNPYNIPLGGGLDYWGPTTPNSSFAFPAGDGISRTTYATLFSLIGTTYGAGNGSTTFNLPDKTGRVSVMKESSSTRITVSGSGINGGSLGAAGGGETQALTASLIPNITSANASQSITVNTSGNVYKSNTTSVFDFPSTAGSGLRAGDSSSSIGTAQSTGSNSISVTSSGTGGTSPVHANVQPSIICNYIMRII